MNHLLPDNVLATKQLVKLARGSLVVPPICLLVTELMLKGHYRSPFTMKTGGCQPALAVECDIKSDQSTVKTVCTCRTDT